MELCQPPPEHRSLLVDQVQLSKDKQLLLRNQAEASVPLLAAPVSSILATPTIRPPPMMPAPLVLQDNLGGLAMLKACAYAQVVKKQQLHRQQLPRKPLWLQRQLRLLRPLQLLRQLKLLRRLKLLKQRRHRRLRRLRRKLLLQESARASTDPFGQLRTLGVKPTASTGKEGQTPSLVVLNPQKINAITKLITVIVLLRC